VQCVPQPAQWLKNITNRGELVVGALLAGTGTACYLSPSLGQEVEVEEENSSINYQTKQRTCYQDL